MRSKSASIPLPWPPHQFVPPGSCSVCIPNLTSFSDGLGCERWVRTPFLPSWSQHFFTAISALTRTRGNKTAFISSILTPKGKFTNPQHKTWCQLLKDIQVCFHPNLHYSALGSLIKTENLHPSLFTEVPEMAMVPSLSWSILCGASFFFQY